MQNDNTKKFNRVITHVDFDGIVSCLLLREIFNVDKVIFKEPADIQLGYFKPLKTDIVCDLPKSGGYWVDHHDHQTVDNERECHYNPDAKSAARVIFDTYPEKLKGYEELVKETDIIDSASYTKESYLNPNACGKISISLRSGDMERDDNYRNYLLNLLSYKSPELVVTDNNVKHRYESKLKEWQIGDEKVKKILEIDGNIAVADLVCFDDNYPIWRMMQIYIDNPEVKYLISARRIKNKPDIKISCGSNIFIPKSETNVDIGAIMRTLKGGGHKGVGGCSCPSIKYIETIKHIKNKLGGK